MSVYGSHEQRELQPRELISKRWNAAISERWTVAHVAMHPGTGKQSCSPICLPLIAAMVMSETHAGTLAAASLESGAHYST